MEHGEYAPPARGNMPGTKKLFGYQFRHDLRKGFPLITTKKMFWKGVVVELLWFLRGETNIKYLVDNGCNIWNEDAYQYFKKKTGYDWSFDDFVNNIKSNRYEDLPNCGRNDYKLGDCGKQYGWLWRSWEKMIPKHDFAENLMITNEPVDQIKNLINGLRNSPESRRHILTAWNPATLNDMALNACHVLVQFNCQEIKLSKTFLAIQPNQPKYFLDCQLYQRSGDSFLGVPFNIASYALLTHIIARVCNMVPRYFIHTFGDVHIYENHFQAVNEQLERKPRALPDLEFSNNFNECVENLNTDHYSFDDMIDEIGHTDFIIKNYNPYPAIKAKLSTGLK